jgi:transketolase
VAELLAKHKPTPIEFVGIQDRFGQSGNAEELLNEYELSVNHIERAARRVLKRKI